MAGHDEALIVYLTKEIELANQLLVEQRSKNNLWVAFGPFLILGGIAANQEALRSLRECKPATLTAIAVVSVIAYAGLGIIAAKIEKGIWQRANQCRRELATVVGLPGERLVFSPKGLYWMYCTIFAALGLTFVGLGFLLYSVHPAK